MILSIGEVVWDIFDNHEVLGGAPLNVAYQLVSLGLNAKMISRVGADPLGRKSLKAIAALGLETAWIQIDERLPTGRVNISVDRHNEPHFDIVSPAAWDAIDTGTVRQLAANQAPYMLVYGTLGQRATESRDAIRTLWAKAERRFYDVNLRPPDTTPELVAESLTAADLVKMNGDELARLAEWFTGRRHDKKQAARDLLTRFGLQVLAVTEGAAGAWLVTADQYFEHPGFTINVADTVGAGDAFFAALIEGFVNRRPWHDCLALANRRGAYVASRAGATPPMETI